MEHLDCFRGICPQLDTAIGYLMENGLEFLVPGHNEVDGEDVFVNHYYTPAQEEAALRPMRLPRFTRIFICWLKAGVHRRDAH